MEDFYLTFQFVLQFAFLAFVLWIVADKDDREGKKNG